MSDTADTGDPGDRPNKMSAWTRQANSPIGQPMTDERKQKMREGRERALKEGRIGGNRDRPSRVARKVHSDDALKRLVPRAYKILEDAMNDPAVSFNDKLKAAMRVLEYEHGKPTQKVELEGRFQQVVYRLAAHEPPPHDVIEGQVQPGLPPGPE